MTTKAKVDARAHPLRRFLVDQMDTADGPMSARELLQVAQRTDDYAGISIGTLNYHLIRLTEGGVVERSEDGTGGPPVYVLDSPEQEAA